MESQPALLLSVKFYAGMITNDGYLMYSDGKMLICNRGIAALTLNLTLGWN